MMNILQRLVLLAGFAFFPFALPAVALAEAGQQMDVNAAVSPVKTQAMQNCLKPGDKKLDVAQVGQVQCCKDHKGVCGCRAGKIVCCDGTASNEPGCTCHGDDGFIQ